MNEPNIEFKQGCEKAFDEEHWQKINYSTGCFESSFAKGKVNYRNLDLEKQRAYTLRNKSMLGLEKLLVDFETHFSENGGKVLWARNADDALTMIFDLICKEKANAIMRSNSMVLDEIGLNGFLERKNVRVVETEVGRFILHEGQQKPYHPLAPSIHLSKEENNAILTGQFKLKPDSSAKQMINFVRHEVTIESKEVPICITGANFLLSDVGGVVLTENEGNILKSTSIAKVHIVVAGIAKMVPSIDDLSVLLPLLSLHASGQSMTACNTITFGPAKTGNGPEQVYVILLDNNRSELLSHEKQRKVMSCIHCGACVSVCPVYKNIGGYSYATKHIGPIGTVMTPLMEGLEDYNYLNSACSLCRKCVEICPVKIPLDDLIIENRHLAIMKKTNNSKYDALLRAMIWHCKSRKKMDSPLFFKKLELKRLFGLLWGNNRPLPEFASKSFSQQWKERNL
ncbi:MAG: lactate utilization protein [Bacteroidales bacterium]|jgi:L-lactate dehydrogenase complex protein LldF|nr:lactate utilization protein [Bacteroidales bacterium]MBR6931555.1 lactate utilization protein [Bacteroidales bacterium]